jgi:hypothetical protein
MDPFKEFPWKLGPSGFFWRINLILSQILSNCFGMNCHFIGQETDVQFLVRQFIQIHCDSFNGIVILIGK